MNIGEAAKAAGLSAKMVRYYEAVGLLPQARRTHSGYRQYGRTDVERLRFIRQARDLGFSLERIAELLSLWADRSRASREVKELASSHIEELNQRIAELTAMRDALQQLVQCCHGDDRPECPILDTLATPPLSSAHTLEPRP